MSGSGTSVVKHGLNPEKGFMQVHYLKGYFLLRFLARTLGDKTYFSFLRKFVHMFHGQLILSQDFLRMLLENVPEDKRLELSVENIIRDWLESSGIPERLRQEGEDGARSGLAGRVGAEVSAAAAAAAPGGGAKVTAAALGEGRTVAGGLGTLDLFKKRCLK
ncbi:aminopeptidase O-like, partial [Nannospalax galili]|uniref:aminopeptidase O-like n=1 Tax=Nannospalax galili TaxID=1026970 RepID=UPI000819B69E